MPSPGVKDKLWIAGFYEGEGSIGCYKVQFIKRKKLYKKHTLHVCIAQKDEKILKWVRKKIGFGSVYTRAKTKMSMWQCAAHSAVKFVKLIYPYMKTLHKKRQMRKAVSGYLSKVHLSYYRGGSYSAIFNSGR